MKPSRLHGYGQANRKSRVKSDIQEFREKLSALVLAAEKCQVKGCGQPALKGRLLCDGHAYPAEQQKSGRRQAIEAQRAKKAKRAEKSPKE